jgi:hypothetical protein
VASYPWCSIATEKEPLHLCLTSRDKVSTIDQVLYPMGPCEPSLPPLGPSNLVFSLEYDLTICETSSLGICVLSSPGFMYFELPSNEAIVETMILDFRLLPELETL